MAYCGRIALLPTSGEIMGLQRNSTATKVFVNGRERKDAHVHAIANYVGGKRANTAEFELRDMPNDQTYRSQSRSLVDLFARRGLGDRLIARDVVDIMIRDRNGRLVPVHHGEIVGGSVQVNQRGEVVVFTSRFDDHLYGPPLYFTKIDSTPSSPFVRLPDGLRFNPIIDNRIFYNKFLQFGNWHCFPESLATSDDLADIDGSRRKQNSWTLIDAIMYLQQYLVSGIHVRRFNIGYLSSTLPNVILNNTQIPCGAYFSEALDILLEPYGFTWKLDYSPRS